MLYPQTCGNHLYSDSEGQWGNGWGQCPCRGGVNSPPQFIEKNHIRGKAQNGAKKISLYRVITLLITQFYRKGPPKFYEENHIEGKNACSTGFWLQSEYYIQYLIRRSDGKDTVKGTCVKFGRKIKKLCPSLELFLQAPMAAIGENRFGRSACFLERSQPCTAWRRTCLLSIAQQLLFISTRL